MTAIQCAHDPMLVALSYIVSVLGSYTALQLAIAIPSARDSAERWKASLFAGAAMGVGAIWAMHFIAMIACRMNIPVTYNLGLTLLSALIPMVTCTGALALVGRGSFSWGKLIIAGLFMGAGVTGMHYTGMAAMLLQGTTQYNMSIVALSAVIAVVASIAALWLAFNMRGWIQMLGSALVMGVAVCGMHYTGMLAATFTSSDTRPAGFEQGLSGEFLGIGIFGVTTVLLAMVLALSIVRQQRRALMKI